MDPKATHTAAMAVEDEGKNSKKKSGTVCGFPISIFFIVINEFCERFSYYGMRAVLVLYFKYFLQWDDDFATTIYHTFVALCYLTPIMGAIVADSWLGKFKTIVYLSIVYTVGQAVLAVSAIHDITDANKDGTPDNMTFHVALSMVGLLLIALGTGGIKPCVSAFGGDQFQNHQEKQRSIFFSIFYLSINAGSLLSTIITPILRAQDCGIYTQQKCYSLAFGVPAALMVVSLIVFIIGSGLYIKTPPQGNILVKVFKCIGFAIKNRFRHRASEFPKRDHWMDWSEGKYEKLLIAQVKMVLKVLFLYIPLPMFWALFDQQGSRWTLQATNMNGNFGFLTIQPDQMQTVNPILILALVPIMESALYPLIAKGKINFTPLRRMTVGMLFAALAFVAAALVQIQIDKTLPTFPSSSEGQVKFININNQSLDVTAGTSEFTLRAFSANEDYLTFDQPFIVTLGPDNGSLTTLEKGSRSTMVIVPGEGLLFTTLQFTDIKAKPEQGANAIRFFNGLGSDLNVTVGDLPNVTVGDLNFGVVGANNMSAYVMFPQGATQFLVRSAAEDCVYSQDLGFGSSFTLIIPPTFAFGDNCEQGVQAVLDIKPNTIHMAWQIPQYFLMTIGEVVFSVTGLEFSYSQAPSNMKSVLQAGWLFTVAVGNIIVLIISEAATLEDQWAEYILFASLLLVVCCIFAFMAHFYTYIDPAKIEAEFARKEPEEEERRKTSMEMTRKDSKEERRSSDSSSDEKTKQTRI
ncbi:solute carrier family 15 member 1b [Pseudoliparis swirei]|uniref:solute carrier family 15 member 1b n=1 Tax=Pseudoliparis swirei TaxID=2059687 RepID=UPI0024BDCF91|nr:solute carrier family 15 member 1b [Pseudoliparis swirei]